MSRCRLINRRRRASARGLALCAWILAGVALHCRAASAETAPSARLEQTELSARGVQQTVLHVPSFGRYTITAKSAQGTALQLVDRMSGPGAVAGEAGKEDGRLDLFLEKGIYLLKTLADPKGTGQVALGSHPARELSPEPAPRLIELRLEQSSLDDLQQRSYWVEIDTRRTVAIEAAGRNLTDLRLWRDGNWLVDAEPAAEVTTPAPGRPLNHLLLVADLNPGLYLLSAYGGPAQPWAETSDEHPLFLRLGIPTLAEAGRRRLVASPFGIDRWRVPARTDYYRLELPKAEAATLAVGAYDPEHPFAEPDDRATIDKKSVPPVAELHLYSYSQGERILTVRREAGRPFLLQHFHARDYVELDDPGEYWLGTLHSGAGEDSVDATAILAVKDTWRSPWKFVGSSAIVLDGSADWHRRFNLLEEATLFFEVREKGNYRFTAEGVRAELRIEPFLIDRPGNYRESEFRPGSLTRELGPGFYFLTLRPADGEGGKGIVTLHVAPEKGGAQTLLESVMQKLNAAAEEGPAAAPAMQPAAVAFRRAPLSIGSGQHFRLYLNEQPGVTRGMVVRRLPIDLAEALPVTQAPGEHLTTRINLPEAGTVTALDEGGRRLPFSIDGAAPAAEAALGPGVYTLTLDNPGGEAVDYVLALAPKRLDPRMPLPPVSADALARRPRFPILEERSEAFFETEREQTTTVNVEIAEPGLYRLESTGLLSTAGILRTRIVTRLDRGEANGVGRNFLIAQYLRQGDYQLSVQPRGKSRGTFGLRLARTALFDGGRLQPGIPARRSLRAGEGLVYSFHVDEAGEFRLRALGLDKTFRVRLEDADGWPLVSPGVPADIRRRFEAGDYRLVILPQPVSARVVSLFELVGPEPEFTGHGPHELALGMEVGHRWMEPEGAGERTPDRWLVTVPAAVNARVDLSREMLGQLLREGEPVARIEGGRQWAGELSPGRYQLEVVSRRPNNRLDYRLKVSSEELVAGQTRTVLVPSDLPVAVGSDRLFELSSFGDRDVRAKLYDGEGTLLASSDDRLDDWNFLISRSLPPGTYRLRTEPVGTAAARTAVTLRIPETREEAPLVLPARMTLADADLHYYPLPEGKAGELWSFTAQSSGPVGLALEQLREGLWRAVGEREGVSPILLAPLWQDAAAGEFRLRVWSVGRTGRPIDVAAGRHRVHHQPESDLVGSGARLEALPENTPPLGVAAVDLERPGRFAVRDAAGLFAAAAPGTVLEEAGGERLAAEAGVLWLARPSTDMREPLRAKRLVLDPAAPLELTVAPDAPAAVDLPPLQGPSGTTQLVLASSSLALPAIKGAGAERSMAPVGVGRRSAVWIRRAGGPAQVELRQSEGEEGGAAEGVPVRLQLFNFTVPEAAQSGDRQELEIPPAGAVQLLLPKGDKRLKLALPAGVATELREGRSTTATLWSGEEARTFRFDSAARTLILYNIRSESAQGGLWIDPAGAVEALSDGRFVKESFAGGGTGVFAVRLDSAGRSAGRRLHIFGEDLTVTAVERSGRILREAAPLLRDEATVLVEHGPGPVLAWLTDVEGNTLPAPAGDAETIILPAQVALGGEEMELHFSMAGEGGLALRSPAPMIVRLRSPGTAERLEVLTAAADPVLPLSAGTHTLLLDSLTDAPLGGRLGLSLLPAEPLREGLSEKRLLAPGEAHLYRFHLEQHRTIGVGAKASVDTVACTLLDAGGKELGRGLVLMRDLQAGNYWLKVETPPDGETAVVQAALVGQKEPDTGPPPEVIRGYLEDAGLKLDLDETGRMP